VQFARVVYLELPLILCSNFIFCIESKLFKFHLATKYGWKDLLWNGNKNASNFRLEEVDTLATLTTRFHKVLRYRSKFLDNLVRTNTMRKSYDYTLSRSKTIMESLTVYSILLWPKYPAIADTSPAGMDPKLISTHRSGPNEGMCTNWAANKWNERCLSIIFLVRLTHQRLV